ncbi:hypothetical protein N0V84_004979 [Fusarium piperis]|uniref:Zn(2)-C6 fungal-type domain-containing protein n=1 Tax=Fusarium piperis TaxID=1435070 RepID=A0A9W8WEL6_9HYPO|nr:hypothetical protein N0V84_004979 [Fusarium piperis]
MVSPTSDPDATDRAGSGQIAGQKRPASDSNNGDRASKRRASKACLSCRNRKVRCDVLSGGQPCTNCRLDKLDCIVKESHRGRKPADAASRRQALSESYSPPAEMANPSHPTPPRAAEALPSPASAMSGNQPSDYLVSLSFEAQQELSPPTEVADEIHVNVYPQNHGDQYNDLSPNNAVPQCPPWPDQPQSTSIAQPKPGDPPPHLPLYIRPLPSRLSSRDVQYLADKGALTIPDEPFRDELLRTYIFMVYPFMPTIEIEEFLHPIVMADGRDPVSMLLFQAIMFASVTFVDKKFLQARGYPSRKAARKDFFGRVRLLFALDCEPDRLSLLQAVLLMTYWFDCPEDDKDTWYWMGIALGLAQVLGLHREPDPARTSARTRQLRRRIWWSCVMRDRLLALGIRRPSRIRNQDFNVSLLTTDDFDLRAPSDAVSSILGESRITAPGPSARLDLASTCVELTKLCHCLGNILHTQYSLLGHQPAGSEYLQKAIVVPQQSSKQRQDLDKCDAELDEWLKNQDARTKYTPSRSEADDQTDEASRIIHLHQALLQMIYLASLSILHKPQAFQTSSDVDSSRKKASREKVAQAAVATTKLAFHFQANDQLRYLSTSSIPAFLSASLIHLMDIRSADEEVRNISIGRFYQCVQALQELQDMYGSADCAVQFLAAVLKKSGIKVPMLKSTLFLPKSDDSRPMAGSVSRSTPSRPLCYPSPSSSRHQQPDMELAGGRNNDAFGTRVGVSVTPLNLQFEAWAAENGQMVDNQDAGEVVPDPLMMGNWVDIDSLVPAMSSFDADSNLALTSDVGFM